MSISICRRFCTLKVLDLERLFLGKLQNILLNYYFGIIIVYKVHKLFMLTTEYAYSMAPMKYHTNICSKCIYPSTRVLRKTHIQSSLTVSNVPSPNASGSLPCPVSESVLCAMRCDAMRCDVFNQWIADKMQNALLLHLTTN